MADAKQIVVLSCSLNPESRSHLLALAAQALLEQRSVPNRLVDLREYDLPFCDGDASYDHAGVKELAALIRESAGVIMAAPIYNYDVNSVAKNLVELTGSAWKEKPVGFVCSAGGRSSYMSPMGMANSLMFDFRSYIVPRFVYAVGEDFHGDGTLSDKITERVEGLVDALTRLAAALADD